MSTNCNVTLKDKNGVYHVIYGHWDGYVKDGVGELLYKHYNTEDKVTALIELGDFSTLSSTIEKSCFYARDKGESYENVKSWTTTEVSELIKSSEFMYIYVFDVLTNEWSVTSGIDEDIIEGYFVPLSDVVKMAYL